MAPNPLRTLQVVSNAYRSGGCLRIPTLVGLIPCAKPTTLPSYSTARISAKRTSGTRPYGLKMQMQVFLCPSSRRSFTRSYFDTRIYTEARATRSTS